MKYQSDFMFSQRLSSLFFSFIWSHASAKMCWKYVSQYHKRCCKAFTLKSLFDVDYTEVQLHVRWLPDKHI